MPTAHQVATSPLLWSGLAVTLGVIYVVSGPTDSPVVNAIVGGLVALGVALWCGAVVQVVRARRQ